VNAVAERQQTYCPKCGAIAHTKPEIELVFGFRVIGGVVKPQSWCRDCRRADSRARSKAKRDATPKASVTPVKAVKTKPVVVAAPTPTKLVLTADRNATAKLFDVHFPADEFGGKRRAWKYMARHLRMKLGDALEFTSEALAEIGD
jgi:hypothetical protein